MLTTRKSKGPAGATARARCDVDSADEQINSQHGATHDPAQGSLWEGTGKVIEWPVSPTRAPRTKRKPKDAGCYDAQPSPLLDFIARTATAGAAADDAGAVPRPNEHETPRARVRARPSKPAVIEPIASHRLAREPWLWLEPLLASKSSRLKPGVKLVGFAVAQFVNKKTGVAFPGNDAIAPRCAMAEDTVRKHVAVLIREGWLTAEKTKFRGSYDLRFTLPSNGLSGTAMPDSDTQSGTVMPDNPARSCWTNRHSDAAQSGTVVPPTPYIEPSTKPYTEPLRPAAFCNDAETAKTNGNPFALIASRVDALVSTKPSIENAIAKYVEGIEIPVTSTDHERVESRRPDAHSYLLQITRSFMRSFGYELGDRAKIDGQHPDLAFVSRCPENALVEMVLRARRGELTVRDVALVATAAGLPRRTAR
jgi:hypothetical protein